MKILHITSWYPSGERPYEALWIKRQIDAIPPIHEQAIYHLAVVPGRSFRFKTLKQTRLHQLICEVPSDKWILIELVNFVVLLYYFAIKRIQRDYDVINFHIAYPQLAFWSILRHFVKKPVVVSEHWSAYHFNFGVAKELPRIQRIFKHGLPFITVSKSLCDDLRTFSHISDLECYVIPNVVDPLNYKFEPRDVHPPSFFMLSQWKWPKKPDVILSAFAKLLTFEGFAHYTLRIGGYGAQLTEMRDLTNTLGLLDNVKFLGAMDPSAIALEMSSCAAFLHSSEYETFSVVCAEALCCGTPVIASKVGGLCELIDESSGVLVEHNSEAEWLSALLKFDKKDYQRKQISLSAIDRFAPTTVGMQYMNVLRAICDDNK